MNQPPSKASNDQGGGLPGRDDDLLEQIRQGNTEAFRALYERYHRRVYAIAFGMLKNPDDAQDVVQDAFIKAHQGLARFQGTSSFYTWLYRIVMNLCIDQLRRNKRRPFTPFEEEVQSEDAEIYKQGQLARDPQHAASSAEMSQMMAGALQQLSEEHRAVLILRELEEMSYEEIAEIVEIPKGTVMSRLFHARHKLREIVEPLMEGAD